MATDKKKKEVKVRDLKPSKDAKGGRGFQEQTRGGSQANTGRGQANTGRGGQANTMRGGAQ